MLTQEYTKKIAKLARLKFTDSEVETLSKQLFNIEHLIMNLQETNCSNIEPLTSTHDSILTLRPDEVTIMNLEDQLFANAPGTMAEFAKEIRCFVVPKVVE